MIQRPARGDVIVRPRKIKHMLINFPTGNSVCIVAFA